MKTFVIANPAARAGNVGHQWATLSASIRTALGPASTHLTRARGDATLSARRAIQEGFERIVVVGGDGTLNEVINGFVDEHTHAVVGRDVTLVVVPMGTGGDWPRSIGFGRASMQQRFEEFTVKRVDLGRAVLTASNAKPVVRHFINMMSFGMSGTVARSANRSSKRWGAGATFGSATLAALLRWKNQPIRLQIDDTFDRELVVNTVAVANGRYFGGAMKIAPAAIVDDGLFDIVVIGDLSAGSIVRRCRRLYTGTHINHRDVHRFVGRRLTATPLAKTLREPMVAELDGEDLGALPIRCEMVPSAIRVLAPWTQAEATCGHAQTASCRGQGASSGAHHAGPGSQPPRDSCLKSPPPKELTARPWLAARPGATRILPG